MTPSLLSPRGLPILDNGVIRQILPLPILLLTQSPLQLVGPIQHLTQLLWFQQFRFRGARLNFLSGEMIMMRDDPSKYRSMLNKKGVTLIELLVVLVICAIVIGGIYKVFIAQTRAYTVQDQVAEVQQDVRGAMDIMVRDIRMAGFQTNSFGSALITNSPIVTPLNDTSITVNYEYIPSAGAPAAYTVAYALAGTDLTRTLNVNRLRVPETLLSNVANLNFSYGIDLDRDGVIDGIVNGVILDNAFKNAAGVGTAAVFAVHVSLTANPAPVNPDVTKMVAPRTLTSVVTPRNMFFKRFQAY